MIRLVTLQSVLSKLLNRYQKGITPHFKSRKVRCLCGFPALCLLFELYRCRRFRAHIIANPVHIFNLRQYPPRDPLQHIPVDLLDRCRHRVHGIDCTDDHHILKYPGVVLHPHRFEIRNDCEILPHLLIQPCPDKFLPQNRV